MTIYNIKKYILRTAALALPVLGLGGLSSCEDMMTVDTGDKAYVNAQDTLYSYLGIMRAMQDVAERQVILGEIRGDLVTSTDYTTDTLFAISNFDNPQDRSTYDKPEQQCSMLRVSDYYNVINNCNFYIHNADTSAVKSNIKYMIPEYAQVKAVRAWAYLQLVKNYKEVPFITEPINNLDVIKNFDYSGNLVNKDNLVDKLIEDGLLNFVDTPFPQYGSAADVNGKFGNGFTDIYARLLMIPIRVVLGDLYLLRGGEGDYKQAARYYYEYLQKESTPLYQQYCSAMVYRGEIDYTISNGWGSWGATYTANSSCYDEVISLVPSSANAGLGKMLTRVASIYGYIPSSSQQSSASTSTDDSGNQTTNTDANGNEVFESSGAISVTPTYKRQYAPSNAFTDVANHQTHVRYTAVGNTPNANVTYIPNCDARYKASIQEYNYESETYPLCAKASSNSQFYYTIPTYRKSLIWLRLAEAINRAGYPEFAFAILKDGLNRYTIPTVQADSTRTITTINDYGYYSKSNGESTVYIDTASARSIYYLDENNNLVEFTGNANSWAFNWDRFRVLKHANDGSLYYVTDSTRVQEFNAFLDFTDNHWNSTYGIHAKGGGFGSWSVSASENGRVRTNTSGYNDSIYYDYAKLLLAQGVDVKTADEKDIINAVENIIVDELALETAFEGNRFTDLVRIAEHKNASGFDGTDWLARKIANRGSKAATNSTPAVEAFDAALYAKLKNTNLWYFAMPAWSN